MRVLFTLLLKFMVIIANIFLLPTNALITGVFPDFSLMITKFNNFLNTYIGNGLSYFFHFLPPNCRTIVLLYLTLLIIFYTLSISLHAILKVIEIIKAIKVW